MESGKIMLDRRRTMPLQPVGIWDFMTDLARTRPPTLRLVLPSQNARTDLLVDFLTRGRPHGEPQLPKATTSTMHYKRYNPPTAILRDSSKAGILISLVST